MIATELKNARPALSKKLTGSTTPSSRASARKCCTARLASTLRASCRWRTSCSMQKYGVSKSSGSRMICAPARGGGAHGRLALGDVVVGVPVAGELQCARPLLRAARRENAQAPKATPRQVQCSKRLSSVAIEAREECLIEGLHVSSHVRRPGHQDAPVDEQIRRRHDAQALQALLFRVDLLGAGLGVIECRESRRREPARAPKLRSTS